jgi:hypothetical protein
MFQHLAYYQRTLSILHIYIYVLSRFMHSKKKETISQYPIRSILSLAAPTTIGNLAIGNGNWQWQLAMATRQRMTHDT